MNYIRFLCGTCVHPWSLNSVVFERIGSSRDLVCNDFLCFGAYFYSRPSLRPCSKLLPFTKKGEGLLRDSSGWTSFFSREADQKRSMSQQSKKRIDVSSTGSFFFILYCSSSEAVASKWGCNKKKLSVIGPFAPRRRGFLCGSRSSRFPLFNLRLFRIPAFILIERAALNRRFFLFSVGKAG